MNKQDEILSELQAIRSHLTSFSPFAEDSQEQSQVEKSGIFLTQPGNTRHDKFILDLLDHEHPVEETTIFYRPTIHSHPASLLRKIGASENKIRRTEVVREAYSSGRFKYKEILSRAALWGLIRFCPIRGFLSYGPEVGEEDVKEHLSYLSDLLAQDIGYQLVLTEAIPSFLLGLIKVDEPKETKRYSLFGGATSEEERWKPSAVIMTDPSVYHFLSSVFVKPTIAHPSSTTCVEDSLAELRKITNHFEHKGSILTPDFKALSNGNKARNLSTYASNLK